MNASRAVELIAKEVAKLMIREHLIEKIKSLPEERLEEVADFIEFLKAKEREQSELAEYGVGSIAHHSCC